MYFAFTKGGKKTVFVSSMLFCIEDGGDEEASFVFVRSFYYNSGNKTTKYIAWQG